MKLLISKIQILVKGMRSANAANRRGSRFELLIIFLIRPDFLRNIIPDFKNASIKPKDLDFYLPKMQTAIECFSVQRQNVPVPVFEGMETDEEIEKSLNSSFRYGNVQGANFYNVVKNKLNSKNILFFKENLILIVDVKESDFLENYFNNPQDQIIRNLKSDFTIELAKDPASVLNVKKNIIVMIFYPNGLRSRFYHIHGTMNLFNEAKSIFWLSKMVFHDF